MSKKKAKPLRWGETVFDRMTHEELLLCSKRMYFALNSAYSTLRTCKLTDERMQGTSVYWNEGVGGCSIEEVKQAIEGTHIIPLPVKGYARDEMEYRSYSRVAADLLFDTTKHPHLGFGWRVCDSCHIMTGKAGQSGTERPCAHCKQPTRALTWDDVKMKEEGDE